METHEAHTASKCAAAEDDFISSMPDDVMSNIMDRLPIQNAVTTSVMSRSWRFKWTLLTQLVFDENFYNFIKKTRKYSARMVISRLLLHLKGAIRKFVLFVPYNYIADSALTLNDLSHWLMFMSRTGIKDFTIKSVPSLSCIMPTHLFSCLELEHLKIHYYCLRPSHNFCGFPNLLSLKLNAVKFQGYQCRELFAQCPLLEVLKITNHEVGCEVKLADIAKLENLKKLSLSLFLLDKSTMIRDPSIFEQMCLDLPKLEGLSLDFGNCKLSEGAGANRVSTAFPYLKTLKLHQMDFSSSVMVSCVFGMIFGSSNLQTLKITATYKNAVQPIAKVDYHTMGKTQIRNVELTSIRGSVNDLCLIESLLAGSPLLQKIVIKARSSEMLSGERGFTTKLLKLHRASPIAEIDITWL